MIITNKFKLTAINLFIFILVCTACKTEENISSDDDIIVSNDDDLTPSPADDDDDVALATLTGVVLSAFAQPLEGVEVSIVNSTLTTHSDVNGHFRLEDLSPSDRAIVTFRKDLYARSSTPVELIGGNENTVLQRMAIIDHVFTFDSSDGHLLATDDSLSLELPSNNIVDASGSPYEGAVVAEVTVFDLVSDMDNGNELFAAPGDFSAVDGAGENKTLESFGMIQVNLTTPSGVDLQLGDVPSQIRLPVQNLGEPPSVGDEIIAWSYDETSGKWIEEALGTVLDDNGTLVWEFSAPHFSTWNCDRPISTHGCLTGTVTDSQGTPRGGATVRAVGITYISTTTARTEQDGSFCLEVKNGETVWAEISYSIAGQTATQRTDPVVISPGQASCSLGASTCDDLGEIPVDIQTCVSGIVIDGTNVPMEGVQVVSPIGGLATTGADGSFCMTTPVFQSSDVFVMSELDSVGYQPVRMYTQPGIPDCQAGCANQVVLRPYVSSTCSEGAVFVNGEAAGSVLVEVFDLNYPDVRVYGTLTNSDGSFCAKIPGNTNVSVQVGSNNSKCASETLNTDNWGGMECADGGQSSECYNLNDFVCNF